VTYSLTDKNGTALDSPRPRQATPINLANHAYFNLAGDGDVLATNSGSTPTATP